VRLRRFLLLGVDAGPKRVHQIDYAGLCHFP
jgi:hypothetical protein